MAAVRAMNAAAEARHAQGHLGAMPFVGALTRLGVSVDASLNYLLGMIKTPPDITDPLAPTHTGRAATIDMRVGDRLTRNGIVYRIAELMGVTFDAGSYTRFTAMAMTRWADTLTIASTDYTGYMRVVDVEDPEHEHLRGTRRTAIAAVPLTTVAVETAVTVDSELWTVTRIIGKEPDCVVCEMAADDIVAMQHQDREYRG